MKRILDHEQFVDIMMLFLPGETHAEHKTGGLPGLGEAAPNFEVCHETLEGTLQACRAMAPLVRGKNPLAREAIRQEHT